MRATILILGVLTVMVWNQPSIAGKQVVGWIEMATVSPGDISLRAKVDTGADTTSLDARNITAFERDGKKMLKFDVDNREGKTVTLELEQIGMEVVPRHFGAYEERPLVIVELRLGKERRNTVVNLVDRSRMKYPLLIGRSYMLDRIVVDPSAEYLTGQ